MDRAPVTHAKYQLFLDEMRAQGKCRQPDHWNTYEFVLLRLRVLTPHPHNELVLGEPKDSSTVLVNRVAIVPSRE
jgi:hypothetical protein